ncbi:SDR family oxidoreductase [Baekduia soli]|uniref:SDR family oxidoreductase n=1 Tax=Baekduia soli TaxID=496014 RepID=A0A5B8U751_9ACTN|nr:SDR family oxidoreductase [Baekduia soli]QEC48492.1 SDR family oxidoreductase [Baekduia soli]
MRGTAAFITGAASGIGRAAALGFAAAGAGVAVTDVDEAGGLETVARIEAAGGEAIFVALDATREADVEDAVGRAVQRFGRLDFACNAAGIQGPLATAADYAHEDWCRVIDLNLTGVWLCMKHEIRQMLAAGRGGAIVNISSNFGLVGGALMPAYSATKHAVIGLTKTAALDHAAQGIRINALCPGATETPIVAKILEENPAQASDLIGQIVASLPMGRMGTAEEAAAAVVWLCSEGAGFVTGAALAADGGYTAR